MKFDVAPGLLLGGLLASFSIAANIRRGDPHLVSMFPDLTGLIFAVALPIGIYLVMRRGRGGLDRDDLIWSGMRLTFAAAPVFAVGMGAFAWWWFPSRPLPLVAFSFFGTLVVSAILGVVVSWLAGRLVGRPVGT